jgi:tryptophanyl-tRNA synthetase
MRVLSGMQPSGQLHIGNYFGSMRPNLEWQDKAEQAFYFVADLHALTTVQDKEVLRKARIDIILDYLACGFDPAKAIMFYQSHVPEHAELMWILSTLMPMGLLERAVSYKDKVSKGLTASVGLFTYPVLMAADILMYDANIVPVGKDQKQHVEFARDIAMKFNNVYGDILVIPEPQVRDDSAIVPGTDGQKMSKSYGNTIALFGSEAATKKAIMGIETDSKGMNDPKDPDACTVYKIHKLFLSQDEARALAAEYKNGLPYGEAKKKLLQTYMDYFHSMRQKREKLTEADAKEVTDAGAKRAKSLAVGTMAKVRAAVGLL